MFISAYDQARFGLLTLRRGVWDGRRILSERWVQMALTPTPAQPDYGFMNWFLNTGRKRLPSAPESAFIHLGNGTNLIYVDPEHDILVVARWIDNAALDGLVGRVLSAIDCEVDISNPPESLYRLVGSRIWIRYPETARTPSFGEINPP